jgi:SAM-dependent methyltransferase
VDLRERQATPSHRHPWEIARARFVVDLLAEHGVTGAGARRPRVLDVGAGDAFVAGVVAGAACDVVACDVAFSPADVATLSAVPGVTATTTLPDGAFDAALALDVIEHVDDDVALLAAVRARVRPGGLVVVTVPAWPALFSRHDVALGHRRRYTPRACRAAAEDAGLVVERAGGLFHALLVPRGLAVLGEVAAGVRGDAAVDAARSGVGGWRHGRIVTGAVVGALRLEQRLSRRWSRRGVVVPGLSFFVVARVPGARDAS